MKCLLCKNIAGGGRHWKHGRTDGRTDEVAKVEAGVSQACEDHWDDDEDEEKR